MRTRGRGDKKQPHHCEWDIGWGSASINLARVFFALVDLKEFEQLPDVYIVPSKVIHAYFKGGSPDNWPRARYHPEVAEIEPFKNNWKALRRALR